MDIKSIFRSKADTVESLVKKHQDLNRQKTDLEKKAEAIKREALNTDVSNLCGRLADIRSQLELSKTAIAETKKQLKKALEIKIQSDFDGLNQEKQKYESQQDDLATRAGANLARGVQSLEALNLSFSHNLCRIIRETIVQFSEDRRFKSQMPEFLKAYSSEINVQGDPINFRDWKKRIIKTEELKPGQPHTERHIQGQIKRLLAES